jgi:hypothetical protein
MKLFKSASQTCSMMISVGIPIWSSSSIVQVTMMMDIGEWPPAIFWSASASGIEWAQLGQYIFPNFVRVAAAFAEHILFGLLIFWPSNWCSEVEKNKHFHIKFM